DGNSITTIASTKIVAKKSVMLNLSFARKDGTSPEITPYLGANAHVTAVSDDGDTFVHAHPMEHGGQLMIHMTFPVKGTYRLWIQFIDGEELRTVPLSVKVLGS
ncbi:MAG: hypothetical protein AAB425_04655, partial [Bdellovibrionota bacterium]